MKLDTSIKTAIWLALIASFPLGLWSFLLSKRIAQGGVLSIFPDSLVPALVAASVVLTVLAVGYAIFVVVRAFYSGATQRGHLVIICVTWALGIFALHCWVLSGLVHMPPWASVKRDSDDMTIMLNSGLTAYEGTVEDRARARAAMQMQMPRGKAVPTVEEKLAIALKTEENQHGYLKSAAATAEDSERLTAKRAWISWAAATFTPVVVLVLAARRTGRQTGRCQPNAPPNAAEPHR